MWEKVFCGKSVGYVLIMQLKEGGQPAENNVFMLNKSHVEARHGSAFSGLLKRYFG